jgi:hypothetical protein
VRFFLPLLLSIRPPLLSIRPPLLPVFDAGLVADAGGEKRASRRGYQIEQIQEACFNRPRSSGIDLFLTSISPGERTGGPAKQPGSPASKSSDA